ncbi:hypothetical protein ACFX2I_027875 [Malus domestica]
MVIPESVIYSYVTVHLNILNGKHIPPSHVASLVLMGLTKTPVVMPTIPSLGKARIRMDLSAVHEILLKTGYSDEEGAENELSFQEWTQQVQDMLNTKKFRDTAFRDKDLKNGWSISRRNNQFMERLEYHGGTVMSLVIYQKILKGGCVYQKL